MILSKKELEFYIASDRIMAGKSLKINIKERIKNFISPDYIIMYLQSLRYVAYYTNVNKKNSFKSIYHRIRYKKLGVKLGFSIGYNTFGYGLLIPHFGTIVINGSTKAGNYCVLHTSTCIGGSGKEIGDSLYLSTGSFIMGANIKLGNNISIAANSLVNKSVLQSNVLLVGSPAEIKKVSLPWYETETDKEAYKPKILAIEKLKREMNL